jgi:hypothetical protein
LYGPADDYFEYVTMLLPGNGTNGAQNNTFLDSSSNAFSITRNGNTTQGTFAPFGNNWGNYFDGSGDWLNVASNAAFGYGTGDFTIEFWVFPTSATGTQVYLDQRAGSATSAAPTIYTISGTIYYYVSGSNRITGGTVTTNQWSHIALCRSGTSTKLFINGVQTGSTYTDSTTYVTAPVRIGDGNDGAGPYPYPGYVSNFRIVKGTALYTAAFTPPTAPLTAITNTSLLTCQSNRFIDNSTNAFAITVNGNTSVQRFSPFNPTAPYAAGTDGGSGYFDGSGDNLSIANNASLYFGTGQFCLEAWVYRTAVGAAYDTIASMYSGGNDGWLFSLNSAGTYLEMWVNPGVGPAVTGNQTPITQGQWFHCVTTRDSSNRVRIFVNGKLDGSGVDSTNCTDTAPMLIGTHQGFSRNWDGYISNLRLIKGSIPTEYQTSSTTNGAQIFTPPTAPVTAIANTQLLTNFTNAGIIDNAEMNNLETVGNAQISTAQSKFGGASMAFDGSGDALTAPPTVNLAMGTGDFTIEMWVYGANSGGTVGGSYPRIFQLGAAQTVNTIECYNAAGTMYVEMLGTGFSFTASTLLNSTWNHFAVTRAGTSLRAFVNGTQVGSTTSSNNLTSPITNTSFIGASTASSGNFSGYIDDLRITKGYARYTANFTPPTTAFPLL